jgi:EAL and modified HD-GYP domain-containing signal transduction protein
LSACRQLREQRYGLAATLGANPGHLREWLRVADVLRVDVTTHRITKPDLQRLLSAAGPRSVAPMATQVETQVQFGRALDAGFEYFQGFFFGEPTIKEGRAIPAPQLTRLKLAQALQDPDLSIDEIEALVKPDAALCYRTLRTVNSAAVPHGNEIKSIREALLRVGRDPIRRWAALWAFSEIGAHASTELLTLSAIRGRFCELLAERAKTPIESSEAFLLGLCSLLDAILERSMTDLVVELPLPTDVRDALLGRDNPMRALLDCATAYGSGEWERAGALAAAQGVDGSVMPKLWVDALRWSRALRTQA